MKNHKAMTKIQKSISAIITAIVAVFLTYYFVFRKENKGLQGFSKDGYHFEFVPKPKTEVLGKGKDLSTLKKDVLSWLKSEVKGSFFKNDFTGWEIGVTDKSIGKWFSERMGTLKVSALTAIEDIIKIGVKVGEEKDKYGNPGIVLVHKFWAIVMINDVVYPIGFLVDETKEGKFIYRLTLIPKEIKPDSELSGFKSIHTGFGDRGQDNFYNGQPAQKVSIYA
jgi:hypothetical protein